MHIKTLHAVLFAAVGHIVVKRILRIAVGVGGAHAHKILAGIGRIARYLGQQHVLGLKDHVAYGIVARKLHGIANIARLKVVGRTPVDAQLTVIDLWHANVERHGLFIALAKALIVLLDLGRNRRGDLLVLVLGDRQMVDIGRSKDQRFSNLAVVLDHLGQASLGQIRAQVLDGTVEFAAERLAAQRTVKQHIAPVVAHAALPARVVRKPGKRKLQLTQHAVVIPIQKVPGI